MISDVPPLVLDLPANWVHFKGCPKLASVKPGRLKSINYIQPGDYVYCPKCQTISYIFNLSRDSNVTALQENNIQYILKGTGLFLQTESSFWKIKYEFSVGKQGLVLFHGNFKPTSETIQMYKSNCYHKQHDAKEYRTIPQILNYIVEHDKFRGDPTSASVKRVPKGSKRQKMLRNRMKRSIQRAQVKHTLDTLDNLKKSASENS